MNSLLEQPPSHGRHLHYLDNLRVAMILMVVIHHAAQAYGPADWWYFRGDRHAGSLAVLSVLSVLSAVGGAFRMSLLFFVAAYFVPRAADRKGSWGFLRGRLKRLGIPFLVGAATIIPVLMFVYYVQYRGYPPISFGRYYLDVFLGFGEQPVDWTGPSWPDLQFGHLWFIQNLLAFSALYALCRWLGGLIGRALRGSKTSSPALSWEDAASAMIEAILVRLRLSRANTSHLAGAENPVHAVQAT